MLIRDLHGLLALVRLLTGEHLIHHDAHGIDVAARVRDTAGDEFGREVRDSAEQCCTRRGVR